MTKLQRHDDKGCSCMATLASPLARRHVLGMALAMAGSAAAGLLSGHAEAAEGNYEAMLLTCIDPRFTAASHKFMADRQWQGKYSHFSFAGAAIGVVAPAFVDWRKTFWDNLATTIQLHHIKAVVALDHRDCGAAKIAYGDVGVTPAVETDAHRTALAEFRRQVAQRHAHLQVITGLLSLDGTVELLS